MGNFDTLLWGVLVERSFQKWPMWTLPEFLVIFLSIFSAIFRLKSALSKLWMISFLVGYCTLTVAYGRLGPHTKATSKSCFYHIRSFRQIRSSMDHTMTISVASALVSSRLDYAISVLFDCSQKHAARLQRVEQAFARVVMQQSSVSPLTSTELLKQLHWLPIEWRIRFKLASL